ncbi:Lycopene beta-cyclase [Amniculicola lignicola CBS 123094]|uniref:Bifunctional lycopene cyclase/phytoene synthase n=1 Tax=Amniculicola lignicola CBS 123094 TaxID=1392246 RepID=A0A6A5X3U7_9PLEO|nr:Lycopene beta-cyclase [Amniculicola lignicola CBS 123094]
MGFDYALVHIKYTIPPAVLLTFLYRPLFTRLDIYKIGFLITVAVVSTIPWDSYLIRHDIWSYPSHVIIGPTVFDIPLEEVFFFVIQTYNTSLLYLILSKPTFQPVYLRSEKLVGHSHDPKPSQWPYYKLLGQLFFTAIIVTSALMINTGQEATYAGLILVWATPFLLLLWTFAYQFILGLPISNTAIPIALPTLYLWIVDTLALKRGTWVISHGTTFGYHLWDGLEIEEALFFLMTNMLIVFGQLAFDNALSILYTFPNLFPDPPTLPSPSLLVRALLVPASKYDPDRIRGLQDAVSRLKRKSRSFFLASATFQGQIRTDLLLLYSFCRVADDLVDDAPSQEEASLWIERMRAFLQTAYESEKSDTCPEEYVRKNFPPSVHSALLQLPITKVSRKPLDELLDGFDMDLAFSNKLSDHPIKEEADLDLYAQRVAGTVALMCIALILHDYKSILSKDDRARVLDAGNRMGIALQCVNIARDIAVDAEMGRVYLPTSWIASAGLSYQSVLKTPHGTRIEKLRSKLLDKAFLLYEDSRGAIEALPIEARAPLRVAVESYMEIGRMLRQEGYEVKAGRATVPMCRRLSVAWRALNHL